MTRRSDPPKAYPRSKDPMWVEIEKTTDQNWLQTARIWLQDRADQPSWTDPPGYYRMRLQQCNDRIRALRDVRETA